MDADALIVALASLSKLATGPFAIEDMLQRLALVAEETLDVDGAGVMVVDDADDNVRFVHARADHIEQVEQVQQLLQQGPCRDAVDSLQEVVVNDISEAADRWWPDFSAAARDVGIRSVVALPIITRGRPWGVLDLYRREPTVWTAEELCAIRSLADVAASFIVISSDRQAADRSRDELAHRSLHDELTGLPNRTLLFDRLRHALTVSARRQTVAAVFFIDLDRFKDINDTFGHAAGDAVLQVLAHRMASTLREEDTFARLSGDEFVLVCEDLSTVGNGSLESQIRAVRSRIERVLARPIRAGGADLVISASIGVATSTGHTNPDAILAEADAAMYENKQRRSDERELRAGSPLVGTPSIGRPRGWELEHDLAGALERGELRLHYQPIVFAEGHEVAAVEALLRWQHPERGLLHAASFIDLAESSGFIYPFGNWVIDEACRQVAEWRRVLNDAAPRTCYVNFSARELADPDLGEVMAAAIERYGLEPHHLGLEIVEASLMHSLLTAALDEAHERGHHLSVDDFGIGYSSLSSLVELPVDIAKIDRSFVAGLPDDSRRRALVDAVLLVARNLDIQVIGEGVETEEQARYLREAGCTLLQGFHFGRPEPPEVLTAQWLSRSPSSVARVRAGGWPKESRLAMVKGLRRDDEAI